MNTNSLEKLYEKDYLLWLETNIEFLKKKDFQQLDLENLIEEIESLGRREKDKLISSLKLIYQHLLKWQYQPQKRSKSWTDTIRRERNNVIDYLEDTPSLKRLLEDSEIISKAYLRGRRDAIQETGILDMPQNNPFSLENTLNHNYLP